MNYPQIAAQLVQMSNDQQRAYLRRLSPGQLVALRNAAVVLQQRTGLGLSFGNLFKNIGSFAPFLAVIPGIGPIAAAAATVASAAFASSGSSGSAAPPPPPPPPPQAPAPAQASGLAISPTLLLAGVALIVLLKR